MSQVIAGQVWESGLEARLKPLAAAIADIVDRDGHGLFASIEYLAWLTGLGERAVQKQMRELAQRGLIVATCHKSCIETPGRGHGRGQSVTYRMRADRLPEREAWASVRARRKGVLNAPFTAERVNGEPVKGERNDTERVNAGAPDPGSDQGVGTDQSDTGARARECEEPLTPEQASVAKYLRGRMHADVLGGTDGVRDPDYAIEAIRRGATREDVDEAVAQAKARGMSTIRRAGPFVQAVLMGCIQDREAGYVRGAAAAGAGVGGAVRGRGAGARPGGVGGGRRRNGGGRVSAANLPRRAPDVLPEFAGELAGRSS